MKVKTIRLLLCLPLVCALLALGLAGCASTGNDPLPPRPAVYGTNALPLVIGDKLTITLSGIPDPPAPIETPIQGDGTISLPDVGRVQAAGKTAGELEVYIRDLYVPKIYTHLSVTVNVTSDRVYFVDGEVKNPARIIYTGPITLSKAITSANGFTDFANRKKVYLTRDGKRYRFDCDKIGRSEEPDPEVYPNDHIEVDRRVF